MLLSSSTGRCLQFCSRIEIHYCRFIP